MERLFDVKVKGGSLSCRREKEYLTVQGGYAEEACLEIPAYIEGLPVTEISKKAFLSNKVVKELSLPDTLTAVGDWAFAYCDRLEVVWLPKGSITCGKEIFKGCVSLKSIHLRQPEKQESEMPPKEQAAALLAAVPVMLEAGYLFSPLEAGERAWFEKLDARLLMLLNKPDEEGYTRLVYSEEENIMYRREAYIAERRREKARLCFLRLQNDYLLEEALRARLKSYLAGHTRGCESEAAWEVVFKEHRDERDFYAVFAAAGCLREDNFQDILKDMGESAPEMKAFLMRYKKEHMAPEDFFDAMSLDF